MAELDPLYASRKAADALKAAHAAGDTENAKKLANYLKNYNAASVVETPVPTGRQADYPETYAGQLGAIPSLIPEMIESFSERLSKRAQESIPTVEEQMKDPLYASRKFSLPSLAVGATVDVIAEGVGGAVKGIGLLIPDEIEDPVKEVFSKNVNRLLNTELVAKAVQAFQGGADSYAQFKKDNPLDARDIETVINTTLLFAPTPKASPESGSFSRLGELSAKSGEKSVIKSKERFVNDLIKPVETQKTREAELPLTEISPVLQTATVRQTADEIATAKLVKSIPDVGYSKTLKANYNNIRTDIGKRANKLVQDLTTYEVNRMKATGAKTRLEKSEVTDRLVTDMTDLINTNPLIRGQESLQKTAEALLTKTLELLEGKPLTPANLIKTRQELDDYILKSKGTVFNQVDENALSIPFRTLRKTLNNIVDEKVPSAKVKESLREQSLLYQALDNIAPKAADEKKTILGRAMQNVQKTLPYQDQRDIWLLAAAGGTGYNFPQLIPLMAGGLVLTGAAKQLRGSGAYGQTKRGVGVLLKGIDKAIKKSENSAMIKQLRADRIYIADMLKNLETVKQEEEGVPELLARP